MRIAGRTLFLFALFACTQDPEPLPGTDSSADTAAPTDDAHGAELVARPLVDNSAWTPTETALDPFYEAAGGKADMCPPESFGTEQLGEDLWFDIETATCGYLTVDQSLLRDVAEGDTLRLRVWRFKITVGDEPFHLALAVGDPPEVIWEETVSVPQAESDLFFQEWPAPASWPAGTPVYWHVSNHGDNSWGFIELSVYQ